MYGGLSYVLLTLAHFLCVFTRAETSKNRGNAYSHLINGNATGLALAAVASSKPATQAERPAFGAGTSARHALCCHLLWEFREQCQLEMFANQDSLIRGFELFCHFWETSKTHDQFRMIRFIFPLSKYADQDNIEAFLQIFGCKGG